MSETKNGSPRRPGGFRGASPERHREIAAMGGRAVPAAKRSFSSDPELAREAGRRGGLARGRAKEKRT